MLEAAPSAKGLLTVAAVDDELVSAASELAEVEKLDQPVPLIVRYSETVSPFRSKMAPLASVVTCQAFAEAAPRAPTWPSLTMPALMVIGPCNVVALSVLRNRVLVPVFVSVEEAAEVMTPKVRSP